ncbi:MAG: SPOR domain-containing protein [Spirochaetales bacterium]|nr:SPOR domain-containing protein [Spirochaetales bacterium]
MKKKILSVSIIFLLSFSLFGTDWSRGLELEKSDDKSSAILFYREWLEENRDAPDYYRVINRFLSIQPDEKAFLQEAKKDWGLEPTESADLEMLIGSVLEISGRIEEATEWFMKSYESFPVIENLHSLLSAAELEIRMGKYTEADKILSFLYEQDLSVSLKEKTGILLSRSKYQQGDIDAAFILIQDIISSTGQRSLEFLTWGSEFMNNTGKTTPGIKLREELDLRFPEASQSINSGAWELTMIPETIFGYFNSGSEIFETSDDERDKEFQQDDTNLFLVSENQSTENSETISLENVIETQDLIPEPVVNVRIQTGSYLDPDNANAQIKDLLSAGFNAEIVQVIINGNQYNRVFVTGITSESLEKEIQKLKNAGFEGFPVY